MQAHYNFPNDNDVSLKWVSVATPLEGEEEPLLPINEKNQEKAKKNKKKGDNLKEKEEVEKTNENTEEQEKSYVLATKNNLIRLLNIDNVSVDYEFQYETTFLPNDTPEEQTDSLFILYSYFFL
jgi:hypothetical protein